MPGPLTNTYGGLKGWQWVAIVGGGGGVIYYIYKARQNAAANAASSAAQTGTPDAGTGPLPGASQLEPIIIQNGFPSQPTTPTGPSTAAAFGLLGNFINTTLYKDLTKAQQALLQPITTANGAHGYIPKASPIPTGAHAGFVTVPK